FFIGSMDWLPNLWGMQWFLKEVWTKLHNKYPNLKLYIAGRNMPEKFQAQKIPNVHIIGEVPDAIAYMRNHAIMIVPLFSGSGMRVKIIEALALGKPIVATTLAAEGIAYKDGQDLLVADNETAFVEKISHLIDNPQEFDEISQNAANFALDKHENKVLIQKLSDFYQTLLDTKEK
ncbi:MAG: glycosyltransferase family 4 protein, partial [Chitinophagales bacterium]